MTLRILQLTVAVCAIGLLPKSADACKCGGTAASCSPAWRADTVFVGHVVSIDSSASGWVAQLAIIEGFRDLRLQQVSIGAARSGDCAYPFRMGQSYVVYASRSPTGQLFVSLCSRTRPVAEAEDDLAYLRSLATIAPTDLARVVDRVRLWSPFSGDLGPLPGVTVTATGEARSSSSVSDALGEFVLTGLPLGQYKVIANGPDGYASGALRLDIHDPRGCGTPAVYVQYDSRVSGRVVDRRGGGVGALPLDLVRASDIDKPPSRIHRIHTWTAADGTFELRLVPPGDYVLGFSTVPGTSSAVREAADQSMPSRAFHPGVRERTRATAIAVAVTDRVHLQDFVVPEDIALVSVDGVAVDDGGRPVRNATVTVRENRAGAYNLGPPITTNADGRFTVALLDGSRYLVRVEHDPARDGQPHNARVASVSFTASAGAPAIKAVLRPAVN